MDKLPSDVAIKINKFRREWFKKYCSDFEQVYNTLKPTIKQARECLDDENFKKFIEMYIRIYNRDKTPRLWVFCGPGATGKSTLIKYMRLQIPNIICLSRYFSTNLSKEDNLLVISEIHNAHIKLIRNYMAFDDMIIKPPYINREILTFKDRRADILIIVNELSEITYLTNDINVIHFNRRFWP